jgi:hypothetical protein
LELKEFPELELSPIEVDLSEPNLEPELDSFLSQWVDCLSRGIEDSFDLSKPPSVGRPKKDNTWGTCKIRMGLFVGL